MTVEVATPDGVRTGWSVLQASAVRRRFRTAEESPVAGGLTGDGVAVVMPGGGALLVSLRERPNGTPLDAAVTTSFDPGRRFGREYVDAVCALGQPGQVGRSAVLAADDYPRLVHFVRPDDPTSLQVVAPNDLGGSFGSGTTLRRILLTITTDTIGSTIDRFLPSFAPDTGFARWHASLPWGDERNLTLDDFMRRNRHAG